MIITSDSGWKGRGGGGGGGGRGEKSGGKICHR